MSVIGGRIVNVYTANDTALKMFQALFRDQAFGYDAIFVRQPGNYNKKTDCKKIIRVDNNDVSAFLCLPYGLLSCTGLGS